MSPHPAADNHAKASLHIRERKERKQMANTKTIGAAVLLVGIIVLVISVLADPLGLGGGNTTFGSRQIAGTVAGVIVTAVGLYLTFKK
jgi:hypothetical protein